MATLTKIPAKLTVGDSLQFIIDLTAYFAIDWTLSYSLVREGAAITISSASDGACYSLCIPASISAEYSRGGYRYESYATAGNERITVDTGEIEILPSFAGQITGYDARTLLGQAIEALEASIAGRAEKTQRVQKIAGVEVQCMSQLDQPVLLDKLRARRSRAGKAKKTIISRCCN